MAASTQELKEGKGEGQPKEETARSDGYSRERKDEGESTEQGFGGVKESSAGRIRREGRERGQQIQVEREAGRARKLVGSSLEDRRARTHETIVGSEVVEELRVGRSEGGS